MKTDTYKGYFDSMPCYLSVQDRDLKIIEANERFVKNFGDPTGRYCYQVYKRRPEKCEDCPVERTFADGRRHRSEQLVRTLDGRDVSILVNTTPIRDENGEITAVMEMSTNITEIKQLQDQLRASKRRYRSLFEDVPCYISIQDQDLRIVEANRLHREAFGTGYGCKCYEVYKHRDTECSPCIVRQTFADGETYEHEEVVTRRDGKQMNVMVTTAPITAPDGEIEGVMEMSVDITQLRELQSKLSSVGMIISSISHDLKGLLNGMDGGMYLVNSGLKKDDQKRLDTGWEMVQRNVERIRSTVLDILYYAKDREPDVAGCVGRGGGRRGLQRAGRQGRHPRHRLHHRNRSGRRPVRGRPPGPALDARQHDRQLLRRLPPGQAEGRPRGLPEGRRRRSRRSGSPSRTTASA